MTNQMENIAITRIDNPQARTRVYKGALQLKNPSKLGEIYEVITADLYSARLNPGDIAIDGGANAGRHTLGMARQVGPGGKVHGFEPSTAVLPGLKRSIAEAGMQDIVILHERALSDSSGTTTFEVFHGALGMSSLKHRDLDAELAKKVRIEQIEVTVTTLDEEIAADTPVKYIKLDLEGAELPALRGGRKLLARQRPMVVFENGRANSARDYGYTDDDFFGFFESISYSLYDALGFPFTKAIWPMGSVPWQFVAIPSEDAAQREMMLRVIDNIIRKEELASLFAA